MPQKNPRPKPAAPLKPIAPSAFEQAWHSMRHPSEPPPTVSARWLLTAAGVAALAAGFCAWGALCLLFWQGSWQLLYRPVSAVTKTPAAIGLQYDSIGFAATGAGTPQLHGWWIPGASQSRFTAIYLHDKDGNLGNSLEALMPLHEAGMNVFAFDYRGYGQSAFLHPSEAHWREDSESAIDYLTNTRHIPAGSLVIAGKGLGANLALEVAAAHPELAGAVLDEPLSNPADAIFRDPRARLVPAHLLVRDRWDSSGPAAKLRVPSLWFFPALAQGPAPGTTHAAYDLVTAAKQRVWLTESIQKEENRYIALKRWLDDLNREGESNPEQSIPR